MTPPESHAICEQEPAARMALYVPVVPHISEKYPDQAYYLDPLTGTHRMGGFGLGVFGDLVPRAELSLRGSSRDDGFEAKAMARMTGDEMRALAGALLSAALDLDARLEAAQEQRPELQP
jgi:hypothetical protein